MDDLISALIVQPKDLVELINLYNSLPNESIFKDSLGLSITSIINFINKRSK